MMPDFTPWHVVVIRDQPHRLEIDVEDDDGNVITQIFWTKGDEGLSPEALKANARLIAAAPDMYEACKAALNFYGDFESVHDHGVIVQLRSALARAERG